MQLLFLHVLHLDVLKRQIVHTCNHTCLRTYVNLQLLNIYVYMYVCILAGIHVREHVLHLSVLHYCWCTCSIYVVLHTCAHCTHACSHSAGSGRLDRAFTVRRSPRRTAECPHAATSYSAGSGRLDRVFTVRRSPRRTAECPHAATSYSAGSGRLDRVFTVRRSPRRTAEYCVSIDPRQTYR